MTASVGPGSYAPRSQPRKIAGNCRRHLRKVSIAAVARLDLPCAYPPVACAMRLQVNLIENPPDRSGADGRHDAVGDGLVSQILTGPVRDVQSPGHGLQTRQRDDLGALAGGKSRRGAPIVWCVHWRATPPNRRVDNAGRLSRPWFLRMVSGGRWPRSVGRPRSPRQSAPAALGTRGRLDCEPGEGGSGDHGAG